LLRLENKVTHLLTDMENIPATLQAAIKTICRSEGWAAGNFWKLDEAAGVLRFDIGWLGDKSDEAEWIFKQAKDVTFDADQGLPGLVWRTGEPLWVPDVMHDPRLESTEITEKTGWNAVFLMPVTSEGRFIGVLDFYAPKIEQPDERLLQVIRILGATIGLYYQRATALERLRESEERFYSTVEQAAIGIAHVDNKGRFIHVNRQLCELLGYTEQELLGLTVWEISHPDDVHVTDEAIVRLRAGKIKSFKLEKRYLHKDGTPIWISLNVSAKRGPDGAYLHEISIMEDISARKQAEQALRDSEARFRSLTELSSDWYWEMDADYRFVRFEGRDREFINNLRKEYLGKRGWETEVDMEGDEGESNLMMELMDDRKSFRDIVGKRRLPDGSVRYSSVSGEPLYDENGGFTGYRGLSRDITEQKQAEQKIRYLATHDGMTGLVNREMFNQLINLAIEPARRYGRRLAVLFLDLDGFKEINDSFGHEFGDRMLIVVAQRLKGCMRSSDVVARLGGDEFVVLIPELKDVIQLNMIAANILSVIAKPEEIMGSQCKVTASIGISIFPMDAHNVSSLMKNADLAMYRAKQKGKNNFHINSTNRQQDDRREET
jgi:diguanylate cyclase (GGDEF)-like protein/PAS domain S-box-containing protein